MASTSSASTACGSRPPPSPTSRATISTITARMDAISPPSARLFAELLPRRRHRRAQRRQRPSSSRCARSARAARPCASSPTAATGAEIRARARTPDADGPAPASSTLLGAAHEIDLPLVGAFQAYERAGGARPRRSAAAAIRQRAIAALATLSGVPGRLRARRAPSRRRADLCRLCPQARRAGDRARRAAPACRAAGWSWCSAAAATAIAASGR